MKATFVGDPNGDKAEGITFRGIYFPRNEVVEIEDEATFKKLAGNSHFACEIETEDKDALVAEAQALGIEAKKTWGIKKLQDAIAEAKAE